MSETDTPVSKLFLIFIAGTVCGFLLQCLVNQNNLNRNSSVSLKIPNFDTKFRNTSEKYPKYFHKEEEVAIELSKNIRLLRYVVMTSPQTCNKKAKHVRKTGKKL